MSYEFTSQQIVSNYILIEPGIWFMKDYLCSMYPLLTAKFIDKYKLNDTWVIPIASTGKLRYYHTA
jgi:hypothetical protein